MRVIELKRNSVSHTEYALFHVIGDKKTVVDTIVKREQKIHPDFLIKEEKRKDSLEEMLMHLAGEENYIPRRK